jgi:cell division transport system permease protein
MTAAVRSLNDVLVEHQRGRRRGVGGPPSRLALLRTGLRSTMIGLRRSGPLPIAATALAALALALVGIGASITVGVRQATTHWRGGVASVIFMSPGATESQIAAIGDELRASPYIAEARYVDASAARVELGQLLNDQRLADAVSESAVPTSWRITPIANVAQQNIDAIEQSMAAQPSVYAVAATTDAVRPIENAARVARQIGATIAVILAGAWCLLALVSARAAVWARRDELALMETVGAPRALIRWPMVLEGAISGLIGGLVASAVTWTIAHRLVSWAQSNARWPLVRGVNIPAPSLVAISVTLTLGGTVLATITSWLATARASRMMHRS